ncbi:MAG: ATP-binding cassette domain-containing protein [Proteobacteria bacterium]|nr:MAG: ATP-binding cassette domain-containing protein [Pseudomonadota bacterium]
MSSLFGKNAAEFPQASAAEGLEADKTSKSELKEEILGPGIVFSSVSFAYPHAITKVIQKLNMHIHAGEHIGIVGPSGCGKSTILQLMLGIVEADEGQVTVSGLNASEYLKAGAFHIAYVGPDPFLIRGTIRENLHYGLPWQVDDSEIWAHIEGLKLDHVISGFRGGLDHQIQENGSGMSAGQKQRLAMVRALLRKPKLMILDEASANLDDVSEAAVSEAVAKLKRICTVVIVSHRKGMLKHADRVLEFDAFGKLELLSQRGATYTM